MNHQGLLWNRQQGRCSRCLFRKGLEKENFIEFPKSRSGCHPENVFEESSSCSCGILFSVNLRLIAIYLISQESLKVW